MLPLKECVATRLSTSLILEFVRKYDLSLNQILAFLGYGYKVRSRAICSDLFSLGMRLRVILVWLSHPSSPIGVMTKGNPFKWKRRPLIYDQWTEDLQIKYSEQDFSWADPRFNKWETDQNKEIYKLKNDPPHPYVDWLLQKSWLTPFKEVRDQDIWVIRDQVFALLNERWETVDAMAANYRDSISKRLARLDKERSIWIQTQNLPGSNNQWDSRQEYSWNNILQDDLSSQTIVNNDYRGPVSDLDWRDSFLNKITSEKRPLTRHFGLEKRLIWPLK